MILINIKLHYKENIPTSIAIASAYLLVVLISPPITINCRLSGLKLTE